MRSFALAGLMLIVTPALADEPLHALSQSKALQDSVTLESFNAAVEKSAAPLVKTGAVGARFTQHDIAFPADSNELRQMHDYALLVVSAWSQMAAELPLRAVYLSNDKGQKISLTLLGSVTRAVPASSMAGKVYGANRNDSLYLLPLDKAGTGVVLMADFAKNRDGFIVDDAPLKVPDYGGTRVPSNSLPPRAVVQHMMDRVFPGFGIPISADLK